MSPIDPRFKKMARALRESGWVSSAKMGVTWWADPSKCEGGLLRTEDAYQLQMRREKYATGDRGGEKP